MRIFVDVFGTILGNPAVTTVTALQAIHDSAEAGHTVVLVSSDPEYARQQLGRVHEVLDKSLVLAQPGDYEVHGALWVDDEDMILRVAKRHGAEVMRACFLRGLPT